MPLLRLWNSIRSRCSNRRQATKQQPSKHTPDKQSRGYGGFNLFGGGPHSALCKLVKSVPAASVLEISVGDGSRAIAMMQTISKQGGKARYHAIDQFEMGGGSVTLKEFHQRLRAEGICPKLFPETTGGGLIRFARTVGAVDLVVIAAPLEQWRTPSILPLLARISHPKTVILFLDEDTWRQFDGASPAQLRRAA